MKMTYKIVQGHDTNDLAIKVNESLEAGFELYETPFIDMGKYICQAMTFTKEGEGLKQKVGFDTELLFT
jgi:hypothetical protein